MRKKAGIIAMALLGAAGMAGAASSPYSSMAVAGSAFTNVWSSTPNMTLVANNTWVTTQTVTSGSGEFKFTANGTWTTNWGGAAAVARVPAVGRAPVPGGGNLSFTDLTPGLYRFTFNDSTLEFRMEWAGASPLPLPAFANMAVVGDFNNWQPNINSQLTNHPAPQDYLWSGSLTLESSTAFQFQPDENPNIQWGGTEAQTLAWPITNGNAGGKSSFTLAGFAPGTFFFTLNVSNASFSIVQTATQEVVVTTMAAQGNFISMAAPPPNMMRVGNSSQWTADYHITNNGPVTLRFAANNGAAIWGVTNGTPNFTLPVSGTMQNALTNYATINAVTPGRYGITFDHVSGAFSVRRMYADNSGINLLKNPGFELTTQPDGGDAVDWGSWQAWPKRVADGFGPHAGNWCGAVHGKWFEEWTDYGSFAQDVAVTSGKTYSASAWLKATPNWSASTMQIKIEWLDVTNGIAGPDVIRDISSLTTNWVKYSVEGTAPNTAAKAHVVFLCSGATTNSGATMQVDDAEFRVVASRSQNFDSWGSLASYGAFAPDWSITSGKTVYNVQPGRPAADVFISQYIEGTGNNKAIEIYNGTLSNLDLAAQNYVLQQYDNGSTTATVTIALSGVLQPGTTLVVGRPSTPAEYKPDDAITGQLRLQTNKYLTFNGDDVIVLRKGGASGTVKDRVGQVGTNATGSAWSRNTQDHTLTRKGTIFTGTVSSVTAAFPLVEEWIISGKDDFTGLGTHDISYIDPNQPYTPAGYSLIMNTNATLMSGELSGGVGDVSFWWRTESMSPAVTMVIETASSESGPWITNATLASVAASNFAYYVAAINRADATYLRIRQTGGATNRFRIDEVVISELTGTRRTEDFLGWVDPSYTIPGNYARYGWAIQNASITTNGLSQTRAALLGASNSCVVSPSFDGGLGETRFWARAADFSETAYLVLQTTTNAGSNWTTQASFTATTGTTFSAWLFMDAPNAQARIISDPSKPFADAIVDSIEIRLPMIYRNQNFDGWPVKSQYGTGVSLFQGWAITDCIVDSQNADVGQVARLNSVVGNYIVSPYLRDGLGPVSFRTRKWAASDTNPTLQMQVSPDGTTWTTLATINIQSITYETTTLFLYDTSNHYVRLYHSAGASRVLVDDIRIGTPQPRPEVMVVPGLSPAPLVDTPLTLAADIVTRYGASIVSVTGRYRIANGAWNTVPMVPGEHFGNYVATSTIPGQSAGTRIMYTVTVQYAGIGAVTNLPGYATNQLTTATRTNFISAVQQGSVWINELGYASYSTNEPFVFLDEDPYFAWTGQNHEFVEICGLAGSDLSGWKLQLALGADLDIAANSNQPIYATYTIPNGTILSNQNNGFGFYVIGDAELAGSNPVNQNLTTLVALSVQPFAVEYKDHIHDGVGVIRLVDLYGNLIYSLSYVGYASGADRIPQSQTPQDTNSVGLIGTGSAYPDFGWELGDLTIGEPNDGQVLQEPQPTNVWAYAWHDQQTKVTPLNTNVAAAFYMLDPLNAANWDIVGVYYGYTNNAYLSPTGTLYHRLGDSGNPWTQVAMSLREGSQDADGYSYVYAQIQPRTYRRLDTMEYFIAVYPNKAGVQPVFLGSDDGNDNLSTVYTNWAGAELHPFHHQFPIADRIFITNMVLGTTNVILQTEGNDFFDPVTNFYVRFTTNLLMPINSWTSTNFTHTLNAASQSMFNVKWSTNVKPRAFYRVDPHGP